MSEMRKAKRYFLPVLLFLAASSVSCGGIVKNAFRSPKVRVIDVALLSLQPIGDPTMPWDFALSLEVDNPNDYPLHVSYVAYSAIIGREPVAEGEHREEIRIGASGTTVVRIPFTIRPELVRNAARESLLGRAVTYELNGSVGMRTPVVGIVRIPFSKTGGFDPVAILKRKGFGFN
jgi:LEA14-like dessication related protein